MVAAEPLLSYSCVAFYRYLSYNIHKRTQYAYLHFIVTVNEDYQTSAVTNMDWCITAGVWGAHVDLWLPDSILRALFLRK